MIDAFGVTREVSSNVIVCALRTQNAVAGLIYNTKYCQDLAHISRSTVALSAILFFLFVQCEIFNWSASELRVLKKLSLNYNRVYS